MFALSPMPWSLGGSFGSAEIKAPLNIDLGVENVADDFEIKNVSPDNNADSVKSEKKGVFSMALQAFLPLLMAGASGSGGLLDKAGSFVPGVGKAPATSSASADGESGDISQTINFGDIVAKGYKFDLGSVPSWFWVVVAAGGGLYFIKNSGSKKGTRRK